MDEDEYAQGLSIYERLQLLARRGGHEVAAYFAPNSSYAPLLQRTCPLEERSGLPTPSAEAPDPQTDPAPGTSLSTNAELENCQEPPAARRKRRATQHRGVGSTETSGDRSKGKRRAEAAADNVPQELGSTEILQELKISLTHERSRTSDGKQDPLRRPELQSEEDVTRSLKGIQKHFGSLHDTHFVLVLERYHCMYIAQLYEHAKNKKGKRRYSLAVEFVSELCPKYVRSLRHLTTGAKRDAMQKKWKSEVHKYKFWLHLADNCGSGVFPLLPEAFRNEHARRLGEHDEERLFTSISARYPNLKEDLKDLTYLVSYFAEHKTLPERQLLLETLDDDQISTMRKSGLQELVSFVEAPRVQSTGLESGQARI